MRKFNYVVGAFLLFVVITAAYNINHCATSDSYDSSKAEHHSVVQTEAQNKG